MTDERDPRLEALFDVAREELAGEAFAADVMARVGRLRRRTLLAWAAVAVVLLTGVWLVSGLLTNAVNFLTQLLPQSLVEVDAGNQFLAQLLAPINSIAAVVALGLFGLRLAYKKLFA